MDSRISWYCLVDESTCLVSRRGRPPRGFESYYQLQRSYGEIGRRSRFKSGRLNGHVGSSPTRTTRVRRIINSTPGLILSEVQQLILVRSCKEHILPDSPAPVVKQEDTLDLNPSVARRGGSSPPRRTNAPVVELEYTLVLEISAARHGGSSPLRCTKASVTQLAECPALNRNVAGSSPARCTSGHSSMVECETKLQCGNDPRDQGSNPCVHTSGYGTVVAHQLAMLKTRVRFSLSAPREWTDSSVR